MVEKFGSNFLEANPNIPTRNTNIKTRPRPDQPKER